MLQVLDMTNQVIGVAQNIMHESNCTVVIPGIMLVVASGLLTYRAVTEERHHVPLTGFLGAILMQMVPMIVLKMKMWKLTDRVSLVPRVLVKTLMMHLVILVFRIAYVLMKDNFELRYPFALEVGLLLFCVYVMKVHFNFLFTLGSFIEHRDVRNLVLLAVAIACISEFSVFHIAPKLFSMNYQMLQYTLQGVRLRQVLVVAANYVDILAFMPAVWRLYQVEKEQFDDVTQSAVVSMDDQVQSRSFFLFIFLFYLWDDVLYEYVMSYQLEPMILAAHGAHFVLLCDFIGFFLFQVKSNSAKGGVTRSSGAERTGLLEASFDDDDDC